MRLLQLLPLFLGLAAAAPASPLVAHPSDASDGGRQSSTPRFTGHDLATAGAGGAVAGAVAVTVLHKKARGMSGMVKGFQKHWNGGGGAAYRKLRGEWNGWDMRMCYRRKYAQLTEAAVKLGDADGIKYPDAATHVEWDRICSSRQTAEADEKTPWIGTPALFDARGRLIKPQPELNLNPSASPQERTVDPDHPNGSMKFLHQVDRASNRLWNGMASWQRGAALEHGRASLERGAARAEILPVLKYAGHE
ncbi:MAG: hypothetical protein M1826_005642 [Phylliscum demangeonii]|nr:MAG: hypothetical protein M1826_005642 [Phylliscum demangeonii]